MQRHQIGMVALSMLLLNASVVATGQTDSYEPFSRLAGPVARAQVWTYDIVDHRGVLEEEPDSYELTVYDELANPVRKTWYTAEGWVMNLYIYAYDSSGRLVEATEYASTGAVLSRLLLSYEGSTQTLRAYGYTGTLSGWSDTELDSRGNGIRSTIHDVETGEVTATAEYSYTHAGEPLARSLREQGDTIVATGEITYNVEGMDWVEVTSLYILGQEFLTARLGTKIVRTDQYGNWLEARHFRWEEESGEAAWVPTSVERRTLTYAPSQA